ncbi:uncharacterized protein LOC132732779 isoform X3 [Ruditapes philippinarum]|uniref:uncharacterized protein LOC132732779 isoform X3 n=1 Tax=Ruditapes philippinarum TaxID=129788 RepID=UPI00295BEDA7|nr:uncharacterized protein LOC132732779 isoform X3 [Ruditapes philippinarum]
MIGNKAARWAAVKELVNRGIIASNKGTENREEFENIVKDVRKVAYLYGDGFLDGLPQIARQETRELFGLDKYPVSDENLAAKKSLLKLERGIYRKMAISFVYDANANSKKSSLSTTRVRQRLCDLMGTDVIRLNDKRYFQTLTKRLQDEYETIMDKQEDARAASEDQRLRRLMLEGIIDAPNDYRAVVLGHDKKQNKKKKRRKIKRHTPTHVTYDLEYKSSDDEGQSKTRKEDVVTQVEIFSGSRPSSLKSRGTSDDQSTNILETRRKSSVRKVGAREKENEIISQKLNKMHARPPHHDRPTSSCSLHRKSRRIKSAAPRLTNAERELISSDDESNATTTEFDTQSLPDRAYFRKQSKYSTHEPERVTKLRTEETVAGLYSIAEELISPVRMTDQPQRKAGKKAY